MYMCWRGEKMGKHLDISSEAHTFRPEVRIPETERQDRLEGEVKVIHSSLAVTFISTRALQLQRPLCDLPGDYFHLGGHGEMTFFFF